MVTGRHAELYSPAIGSSGSVVAYGHWGRPVLAFPAEGGSAWDLEHQGMVGAVADLIDGGPREALLRRLVRRRVVVEPRLPLEERARNHERYESWIVEQVVPHIQADSRAHDIATLGVSLGAYHAVNFALKRADLFPLALGFSGNYDPASWHGWGERGEAAYFNNPLDYVEHMGGDHLDWLRERVSLLLVCGQGQWEDTTGSLESTQAPRRRAREQGHPARAGPVGARRPARLAVMATPTRASSATVLLMADARHLIGLLLGTEEDWPRAFETLLSRIGPIKDASGTTHTVTSERITMEPFDLRDKPRYDLVIDRLAYWYYLPREWLKKVALMDDVYLLNSPFTFQSMEKHAAYCAMLRLGLKVPQTVLVPHKNPPDNARFAYTAAKYNRPFDLDAIAEGIGYPLFMKPYDGGQWIGVSRIKDSAQLHRAYDESGQRLMHLQASVEGFDVFARSLIDRRRDDDHALPPRRADARPLRRRPRLPQPRAGRRGHDDPRLINAFFRWEFNSCETLVRGTEAHPIDYANASPDVALTSLHYYFPWAMSALIKWCTFCVVTGREPRMDLDTRNYFEIGDREDLSYKEKLAAYRELADAYFEVDRYQDFVDSRLSHVDELVLEWITSADFDRLLLETVRTTYPPHEHERFIGHFRGLVGQWVSERGAAATWQAAP